MIKDIGSIFPIYTRHSAANILPTGKRQYFSMCREILHEIARQSKGNKVALLPAYTCSAVIQPFKALGWKVCYYAVSKELRICVDSFKDVVNEESPSIIVVHPYFGMELNRAEEEALQWAKRNGECTIILDNTQCAYSNRKYDFVDYTVASIRKWLPIAEGAYVEGKSVFESSNRTNSLYNAIELDAMYLRGLYFKTGEEEVKEISRRLDAEAIEVLDKTPMDLHSLESHAVDGIVNDDQEYHSSVRISNYQYLYANLSKMKGIHVVLPHIQELTTAPLLFPFYADDLEKMQRFLAPEHIYAQRIWRVEEEACLMTEEIKYIYDHLLVLFIDQRYDNQDMQRIINRLRQYE